MAYCRLGEIYDILDEGTKASEYLTKAYQLRDRVTERKNTTSPTQYYFGVTGEMEKAKQAQRVMDPILSERDRSALKSGIHLCCLREL